MSVENMTAYSSPELSPESMGKAGLDPLTEEEAKIVISSKTEVRTLGDIRLICPKFEQAIFNSFAVSVLSEMRRSSIRIKKAYRGE